MCTSSISCTEVGINNNSSFITGYGAPAGSSSSVTNGAYNTDLGKDASTTGNIYGIYDMSGGAFEYVMGAYADSSNIPISGKDASENSGFNGTLYSGGNYSNGVNLPDNKYFNIYSYSYGNGYQIHALTETKGWYSDNYELVNATVPWFLRGNSANSTGTLAGIFATGAHSGIATSGISSRLTLTNE